MFFVLNQNEYFIFESTNNNINGNNFLATDVHNKHHFNDAKYQNTWDSKIFKTRRAYKLKIVKSRAWNWSLERYIRYLK